MKLKLFVIAVLCLSLSCSTVSVASAKTKEDSKSLTYESFINIHNNSDVEVSEAMTLDEMAARMANTEHISVAEAKVKLEPELANRLNSHNEISANSSSNPETLLNGYQIKYRVTGDFYDNATQSTTRGMNTAIKVADEVTITFTSSTTTSSSHFKYYNSGYVTQSFQQ